MSEVIYKFEVFPYGRAEGLELPIGAKPLSVGCQNDAVVMWIKLDPDSIDLGMRHFYFIGTGQELPNPYDIFIGRATSSNGFEWHVFEYIEERVLNE